jgi:hypothetical protein
VQTHSQFVRTFTSRGRPKYEPDGVEHWSVRKARALRDTAAAIALMTAILERLRDSVEADGARLVVAVHPNKVAYRRGAAWVDRVLVDPALYGVQVVRLTPVYRRAHLGFGQFAADDIGHLNASGHRLTAAALRRSLSFRLVR